MRWLINMYNRMNGRNKFATVAYGWNVVPYIPAIGLNTIAKYESGFKPLANAYSNLLNDNFNPTTAGVFGLLRLFDLGVNKYANFIKAGAAGVYVVSSLSNIIGMFPEPTLGDGINLLSNGLLAGELITEVRESLARRNRTMIQDLREVPQDYNNLERIVRRTLGGVRGRFRNNPVP